MFSRVENSRKLIEHAKPPYYAVLNKCCQNHPIMLYSTSVVKTVIVAAPVTLQKSYSLYIKNTRYNALSVIVVTTWCF